MKVFHPEVFQGNLHRKNYFEGWYLKHVSPDMAHVFSFIPGIALTKSDPHAFIQVIDGVSGKSWYARYDIADFHWNRKRFWVRVGQSVFAQEGSDIDMEVDGIKVKGRIGYENAVEYPSRLFSPGIMGWYSFVPYMECKHAVVSVDHRLSGGIDFGDVHIDFSGGNGYIEKDWGTSFPAAWLWLHSNTFISGRMSVMLSIAKIPWLGSYFMGFICFVYDGDKFYLFSTYNGSKITRASEKKHNIEIHLSNGMYEIEFEIFPKRHGHLRAPKHGEMKRKIKESIDSDVIVRLKNKQGDLILDDKGIRSGLEVTEHIFDLLDTELNGH